MGSIFGGSGDELSEMLRLALATLLAIICLAGLSPVLAQQQPARIGLLIANQSYNDRVGPLRNPHNDIALVGGALKDVGFDLLEPVKDAGRDDMLEAVHDLGARLRRAGRGAIGFLYYTGHGVSVGGENVLIPANAPDTSDRTLNVRGVKLSEVLDTLKREAPDAVLFVIVDACRNNLRGQRGSKGFVPVTDQRTGVVLAFATAAGDTASDEGPRSGPYAEALAAEIVKPGRTDQQVFNAIRAEVVRKTRTQTPWTHDGLIGDRVVFKAAAIAAQQVPAITVPAPPAPAASARLSEAAEAWTLIRDTTDIAVLEAYIRRFGDTFYGDLAKSRLATLRDERQRVAVISKQDEARKPAESTTPPPVVHGVEKTKLYVVTFAPGGKLEAPPYTGGTIRRDYAGYAGTLVRDDRGTFEIKVTDVNVAGQGGLRHECTGGAALSAIKVGDIVHIVPGNCTTLTDYFVPGAAFEKASAAVVAPPAPPQRCTPIEAQALGTKRCLEPGDNFRDCPACPEMVVVPAGNFMMGSTELEGEQPVHIVALSKPFAVGRFEVSFDEWEACLRAGGCLGYIPNDAGWGRGKLPVIRVSWEHARAYVSWLKARSGRPYRLLSEAEWEYVARAGTNTKFWWGDKISSELANYDSTKSYEGSPIAKRPGRTTPIDKYHRNPFGLFNVLGNVSEWVEDCFYPNYIGAPSDGTARITGEYCNWRIHRGGAWSIAPEALRSASRAWQKTTDVARDIGFRVARDFVD